jgi:hypothetical protein
MGRKKDNINDYIELLNYFQRKTVEISESSLKGHKYIKGVLTSLVLDLDSLILLQKAQFPGRQVNQQAWDDYLIHIKRCFLHDLWSVTEGHIRNTARALDLKYKGRNMVIRELVAQALKKSKNAELNNILKKIEKKCRSKFVEFPSILPAVLKAKLTRNKAKEWITFFEILRLLRNATHNNFIAQDTKELKSKLYSKSFTKGQSISLLCGELKTITEVLLNFFVDIS